MAIPTFKSFNQIYGDMARKLLSMTGLSDLYKGSVLSTLLEAAAQEDFSQYGALIDVINNFALDSTTGADLNKRASEYSLTRLTATVASGFVTISDGSFSRVASGLYIGGAPPIAGDTAIRVADASGIAAAYVAGVTKIYIGRGTANFEGPILLSGIPVDNVSYWTIPIAAVPLSKNHNLSETVIMAQGGNRTIPAGITVKVLANNVSSEVTFSVATDQTLADGEVTLTNVLVYASQPGTTGNVPLGAITTFSTAPFSGAAVTNPTAFSNARDLETDQELRDRIKEAIQSLSKGTSSAIISGVIGVTDPDENKRVASASLIEPTLVTDIAKLYVDDGTGFEPSYDGQGLETLVSSAVGTEQFLQLGNFPLVKAQVESISSQPFALVNGHTLSVAINDVEETLTFLAADFAISGAATALEVATAINNRATTFEARTTNGQKNVVVFARVINNEKIEVTGGTGNDYLLFPTDPVYTLKLYKNEQPLSKDGETAFLESTASASWSAVPVADATLTVQIDGKLPQYLKINDATMEMTFDIGLGYTSVPGTTFTDLGVAMTAATAAQWAIVLDQMVNGATVTANGTKIKITSNTENSASSGVQILAGGNLTGVQGWSLVASAGKASDFDLNRFNGQLELGVPLVIGDRITAGSVYTRAQLFSAVAGSGVFDLTAVGGRQPIFYAVIDGASAIRVVNAIVGNTITVSNTAGDTWKYLTANAAFSNLVIGDYVVVVARAGGLAAVNCGIFKVTGLDGGDKWFEVTNPAGSAEGPIAIAATTDIQAFVSEVPPQKVQFTAAATTIQAAVDQINAQLAGASAEALDDGSIRFYTHSYSDAAGSLHVPVVIGNASSLAFSSTRAISAPSHIAFVESLDQIGFRISGAYGDITTADLVSPYTDVFDGAPTPRTFTSDGMTLPGQWVKYMTGNNEDVKGVIRTIVGNTQLLLRDNVAATPTPQTMVDANFLSPVTVGDLYQQFAPYDLEDTDNLVAVLDNDEANKTYNVVLSRRGRINVKDTTSTFDALDTDATSAGTDFGDALWLGYDFSDYKLWMKARRVINPTNDKNAMIIRAKKYGPTGEMVRVSFAYSSAADTPLSASLASSDTASSITVSLGTGVEWGTSQDMTTTFTVTNPGGLTTWRYTSPGGTAPGLNIATVGSIMTFSGALFSANNRGTFKVTAVDPFGLWIEVTKAAGTPEGPFALGLSTALSVYPLLGNTGLTVRDIINNTAGVKEMVEAVLTAQDPFGTANTGTGVPPAGVIEYSTLDDPAIASQWLSLTDGQNWVREFSNPGSPQFTLKEPLSFIEVVGGAGNIYSIETAPVYGTASLGEPFRLIPTTAKNVLDHMNKSAISAISLSALVQRSSDGNRIQIASLESGSAGSVHVSGGLGNGNFAALQSNAIVSGSSLKMPILTSTATGFHVGQAVKLENLYTTNKVNTFAAATTVTALMAGSVERFTLNKRVTNIGATSTFSVTAMGSNVFRYTVAVAGSFSLAQDYDELNVLSTSNFNAGNEGTFPIVNVDGGGTYVDVINPNGVGEAGPIAVVAADVTVAVPFFTIWPHEADGTTVLRIEKLSQNVVRYRWTGVGTQPYFLLNGLAMDDTIEITDANISTVNQGTFTVLDVSDEGFSIINANAVEEEITLAASSGIVCKYVNSALVGDVLDIGALTTAWFAEVNQGLHTITAVDRDATGYHYVTVTNALGANETITLGANNGSFFVLEGTPFVTYRTINNMCVNDSDPLLTEMYVSSVLNPSRFATAASTQIHALNKLGFSGDPAVGIDGYKYWTGLLRRVQRTVDGYDLDPVTYPGIKAAGVQMEVTPPLLQSVSIGLDVRTTSGVPLSTLIDSVKSAVLSYINSLGVGGDVVLSQIVKRVQEVPGIEAVRITDPAPVANQAPERITIQDDEKAIAYEDNITVG